MKKNLLLLAMSLSLILTAQTLEQSKFVAHHTGKLKRKLLSQNRQVKLQIQNKMALQSDHIIGCSNAGDSTAYIYNSG